MTSSEPDINVKQLEMPFARDAEHHSQGQDERNLMEWVVGVLAEQAPEGVQEIEYRDTIQTPKASEKSEGGTKRSLDRVWRVQVSGKNERLPAALENDLLVALQGLTAQQGNSSPTVEFSIYRLCKIMKKRTSGQTYHAIRDGINRLANTTIVAENAFYDKAGHRYRTVTVNIFQDTALADRDDDYGARSFVTWTRAWFASMQAGYVWPLNMDFYFSLKSPLEKKLFRNLNGKSHYNSRFTIELRKWAFEHLGMSRTYTDSQIKRNLRPHHESLERRGFLAREPEYGKNTRGEWQVTYFFVPEIILPPEEPKALVPPKTEGQKLEELRRVAEDEERKTARQTAAELEALATDADREEARRQMKERYPMVTEGRKAWDSTFKGVVRQVVKERLAR